MKINIQIEVDWIEENGNIDNEIQNEIIHGVKKAISKDCLKIVEAKTQKAIDDSLTAAIKLMQEKVSAFFDDWLNTEAAITDRYGDKIKQSSLRDIIKERFDKVINEKVDMSGNPNGYGNKCSRLEFITGKKVTEVVDNYLSSYSENIDKSIKETIEQGIKSRVSDKFAEMVIGYAKKDFDNAQALTHQS